MQRELNTLGVRQIVPRGPHALDMYWTMFGYADDSPEMEKHRMRQGNLMGPSGYSRCRRQRGDPLSPGWAAAVLLRHRIVMLDPAHDGGTDTLISEASIRSLYGHYREVMGL